MTLGALVGCDGEQELIQCFTVWCPQCLAMGRRGEWKAMACLYVTFTDDRVNNLIIDCDQQEDHMVGMNGPWKSPVIKDVLKRFDLTKRKVIAAHTKRHKMETKEAP